MTAQIDQIPHVVSNHCYSITPERLLQALYAEKLGQSKPRCAGTCFLCGQKLPVDVVEIGDDPATRIRYPVTCCDRVASEVYEAASKIKDKRIERANKSKAEVQKTRFAPKGSDFEQPFR